MGYQRRRDRPLYLWAHLLLLVLLLASCGLVPGSPSGPTEVAMPTATFTPAHTPTANGTPTAGPLQAYTPSPDQFFFIEVREQTWDNAEVNFGICRPYGSYGYYPEQGFGLSPYYYDRLMKDTILIVGHDASFNGPGVMCAFRVISGLASVVPLTVSLDEAASVYMVDVIHPLQVETLGADGRVEVHYGGEEAILYPGASWAIGPRSVVVEGITYTTTVTIVNYGLLNKATHLHRWSTPTPAPTSIPIATTILAVSPTPGSMWATPGMVQTPMPSVLPATP